MLHKLNKDELILIIENISKNHKKAIEKVKDEYEAIITGCKDSRVKFRECPMQSCKAFAVILWYPKTSYLVINCSEIVYCQTCNDFVCNIHARNCHKN